MGKKNKLEAHGAADVVNFVQTAQMFQAQEIINETISPVLSKDFWLFIEHVVEPFLTPMRAFNLLAELKEAAMGNNELKYMNSIELNLLSPSTTTQTWAHSTLKTCLCPQGDSIS